MVKCVQESPIFSIKEVVLKINKNVGKDGGVVQFLKISFINYDKIYNSIPKLVESLSFCTEFLLL